MNREILDRLSVITEEEQEILSGRQGIDPTRYTEKKELVIDSGKMLEHGKLIRIRPQDVYKRQGGCSGAEMLPGLSV